MDGLAPLAVDAEDRPQLLEDARRAWARPWRCRSGLHQRQGEVAGQGGIGQPHVDPQLLAGDAHHLLGADAVVGGQVDAGADRLGGERARPGCPPPRGPPARGSARPSGRAGNAGGDGADEPGALARSARSPASESRASFARPKALMGAFTTFVSPRLLPRARVADHDRGQELRHPQAAARSCARSVSIEAMAFVSS